MISLTATELPRFMQCNGSFFMGGVETPSTDTTVKDEGDAAHWFVEQIVKRNFQPEELIERKAPNGVYITPDMYEHLESYIGCACAEGSEVEVDTSHSGVGWEVRGRADRTLFDGNTLFIDDLKFGWRIVEPEENWTLISHAIALCVKKQIRPQKTMFTIHQPRAFHHKGTVRSWEIDYNTLVYYFERLDQTLASPSMEVRSGPHCYKCKSRSQCPAMQIANMNALDVSRNVFDSEISNEDLSILLDETKRAADILEENMKAYKDLALHRVKEGQQVENYSIETSLGKTKWKDGVSAEFIKAMTNIDVSKKQIVTPAQAKRLGVSEDLIKSFTERPDRGFKLSRVDQQKKAEKLFGKK